MRQELNERLERLIPRELASQARDWRYELLTCVARLKTVLFPDGVRGVVDPISSRECNAHLVGMLLDSVVVAALPELVVSSR